jgi:hypothetical protein
MNSDDEDAIEDVKPDKERGMYTVEMDPRKDPVMLTQAEVAAQRAASKAVPRSQTPVSGSSDDDDPDGPEFVWSQTKSCMRRNKNYRKAATVDTKTNVPVPVPEPTRKSTPVNSDSEDQEPISEDQRRMIDLGKKMARKGTAQGTSRTKPPEEAKASHPRATRKTASRAGSLRPGGGSGQTDTCVASGNPSKT